MKLQTKQNNHTRSQGSALMLTLGSGAVIGLALASYLTLVANQNQSISRSQTWNVSIPVLEAGLEEAMTQIQFNGITSLLSNGWTLGTDGFYHKTRYVGTDGSYYEVSINPQDPPEITSRGYVPAPANCSSPYAMILGAVTGSPSQTSTSRKVKVTTQKIVSGGGGGSGLNAKGKITFSGGGSLDSFNSADSTGTYCDWDSTSGFGKYNITKRKAGGYATTNSKVSDSVHVDTAKIYGKAITGPGGTVTCNSGAVGTVQWDDVDRASSPTGIQTGASGNDANIQFNDETVPFTTGYSTPASGTYTVGGTNYTWQFADGNYKYSGDLQFSKSAIVTGNAVLYTTGKCTTSGSGFIYIAPGASLQIYVGTQFVVSGTGVVNGTQQASKFGVHGLSTCTTVTYSGSSAFVGTVNAPYAAFTFSGSSGGFGSFNCNTVTISGGAAIHVDEALNGGNSAAIGTYVPASWNEIPL